MGVSSKEKLFNNKYIRFTVKFIFGIIVFTFVGLRISKVVQENTFTNFNYAPHFFLFIGIICLGMVFNWSLEALKWQKLMETLRPYPFKNALKAVFSGVSTGIMTPNRLGNFIGRIAGLEREIKVKATLLTLLSNLAQFVVTIFFGIIGIVILGLNHFKEWSWVFIILAPIVLLLGIIVYLQPRLINQRPFNFFFTANVSEGITFVGDTSSRLKWQILGISALRYSVFVTQYVLLFFAFDQPQPALLLFGNVAVVYLLMTLIPSLFFGKLFVREAAGLFVLSTIGIPDNLILLTGFLLWFVNIALPSIVGSILLMRKKW